MRRLAPGWCALVVLGALGCGRIDYDGPGTGPGTEIDAAPTAQRDASILDDAGILGDAGSPGEGRDADAGPREDAGTPTLDAGAGDAATEQDAGVRDSGAATGTDGGAVVCTPGCSLGEYCVVRAECTGTGTCQPRPTPSTGMCPDVYEPVCGCDGITYSNSCQAGRAGMSTAFVGTCEGGPAGT